MEVTYEAVEDPLDPEGTEKLAQLFDILWKHSQEDSRKKARLKNEPDGFPVDGHYTCLVCGGSINEKNGWYDWFGQTCLFCHKAVKEGIIPTFIFKNRHSYFQMWALKYTFDIKPQTAKKYIKEGKLIPRIILDEDGKVHEYIFLKKENPGLIERYSPERKSYDRHHSKVIDAWSRKLKEEMKEEHRKHKEKMKKKYPNLYK